MKTTPYEIPEWPEKTLFTRQEAAQIMEIGVSTLDSLISYSALPRTVIQNVYLSIVKNWWQKPRKLPISSIFSNYPCK